MREAVRTLLSAREWVRLLRPGDYIVLLLGAAATAVSATVLWSGDTPSKAVVRLRGETVASLPLNQAQHYAVRGPLGLTQIEIQPGRARVAADPGPRQYCVKQGWLTRSGAAAICAPNEITLQLEGRNAAYDSLTY